ncbi:somatostatin 1.2 [Scleropages formosus]|uniref:Somatostatin 1, tandem duplicate 2 n=1 Tax=Scleropages formosus TaxID=113540 RepID=A0A8C9S0T4_SCLFO|nr:somatostatin-2-like [Scleropages formosus]
MKICQIHCTLVLLGLVLGLFCPIAASQPDLRYRSFLQRAHAAAMSPQDWSKQAVENLLSQLAPPQGEVPQGEVSAADEGEEVRVDLERSLDPNNLPPRERKAGCKNFYWKGFTSC